MFEINGVGNVTIRSDSYSYCVVQLDMSYKR